MVIKGRVSHASTEEDFFTGLKTVAYFSPHLSRLGRSYAGRLGDPGRLDEGGSPKR